jgi:hypothetical protein
MAFGFFVARQCFCTKRLKQNAGADKTPADKMLVDEMSVDESTQHHFCTILFARR